MTHQKILNVLNKHVDKSIKSYFCSECDKDHKRFFKGKFSIKFFIHLEYKIDITTSERFNRQFKRKWRNEVKTRGNRKK